MVGVNRINHTPETSADKVDQYFSAYAVGIGRNAYQGNPLRVEDRVEIVDVHISRRAVNPVGQR
jgi:hypothetical protein